MTHKKKKKKNAESPPRSKTHHYVPQLLLSGFADDARKIHTIDLSSGKGFDQNIASAAAENNYNTIELIDGSPSDVAEVEISSRIENPAVAVIHRIRNGGWIKSETERHALARFVAFQFTRVPRQRDQRNATLDLMAKLHIAANGIPGLERAMANISGPTPETEDVIAQWNWMKNPSNWKAELSREGQVASSLRDIDGFARILEGMYVWGSVRWERRHLLTSDSPLLLLPFDTKQRFFGVGLGTAGSIYLGLDRRCALILASRESRRLSDGFRAQPTVALATAHNRNVAMHAKRWIFHHPSDEIVDLVGNDFELPFPEPISFVSGNNEELLHKLSAAAEWHAANPSKPHPLSKLPLS